MAREDDGTTGLMDQLHAGRSKDFETTRDGNTVTLNKLKPKKAPAPKPPSEKRPSNYQDAMDAKTRAREDKAPTTKTEMGEGFKKGGSVKGWGKARGAKKCKVC